MKFDHSSDTQHRMGEHYNKLAGWMDRVEWYRDARIYSVIESLVRGRPRKILELCSGTGQLLEQLSTTFPTSQIIGIDISPGMVDTARQRTRTRSNVTVLQGDWVSDLTAEDADPFDVIVVKNALHLLDGVDERLRQLGQLAHPLTTLIVVETVSPTADANAFIQRLFSHLDASDLKRSFFTEQRLSRLLRKSGWNRDMAKPVMVEQAIDVADWLSRKVQNQQRRALAIQELVRASTDDRIRNSMAFDMPAGLAPAHMLRLQHIGRYYWASKDAVRPTSKPASGHQLELM